MKPGPLRRALGVAALLVLIVLAASAFIRLTHAGLDCAPWPACYARQSVAAVEQSSPPAAESTPIAVARGIHRIAASAVGILLLGIVLAGWDKFRGAGAKGVALAALALTAFLAWLGRYTPSDLPAVVLGNMLGGMLLLGLLWSLAGGGPEFRRERGGAALGTALASLTVQMALGGVLSARRVLLSCPSIPACNGQWWAPGADSATFNPFAPNADVPGNGAALILAHRYGALVCALLVAIVAVRVLRAGGAPRAGTLLLALLIAQMALGAGLTLSAQPLALAVLHNVAAAALAATLVSLSWPMEVRES